MDIYGLAIPDPEHPPAGRAAVRAWRRFRRCRAHVFRVRLGGATTSMACGPLLPAVGLALAPFEPRTPRHSTRSRLISENPCSHIIGTVQHEFYAPVG